MTWMSVTKPRKAARTWTAHFVEGIAGNQTRMRLRRSSERTRDAMMFVDRPLGFAGPVLMLRCVVLGRRYVGRVPLRVLATKPRYDDLSPLGPRLIESFFRARDRASGTSFACDERDDVVLGPEGPDHYLLVEGITRPGDDAFRSEYVRAAVEDAQRARDRRAPSIWVQGQWGGEEW